MSSNKPGKWGGSGKWGTGKPGDDAGKTEPSRSAPHQSVPSVAKRRVSVAQPQRSIDVGRPLSTVSRAAAERDARLGRRVIFGVLAITFLVFGTNLAGLWKTPGQQQPVRQKSERKPGPTSEAPGRQRASPERRESKEAARLPQSAQPNLAETDCQTTKSATAIISACSQNRELAIADYRRALEADQNFKTARENLTGLGEKP